MANNIDATQGPQGAWPSRAHEEVTGLRSAITAQIDEPMVAASMAPMMGELLTRLEGFSKPRDAGELTPPEPPTDTAPMSQGEAVTALHEACGALREQVLSGGSDPQTSKALQSMVDVIEGHLSMKGEIVARATSDATPG